MTDSSSKRKRDQRDEGDEMRDSISSDGEPEVQSTRPPPAAAAVPPAAKRADISRHCKYFSTGGTCGKKGKCRFVHDAAVREAAIQERNKNNGQLTIRQRLALNDKGQDDLTILQSVQYLLDQGVATLAGLRVSTAEPAPANGDGPHSPAAADEQAAKDESGSSADEGDASPDAQPTMKSEVADVVLSPAAEATGDAGEQPDEEADLP